MKTTFRLRLAALALLLIFLAGLALLPAFGGYLQAQAEYRRMNQVENALSADFANLGGRISLAEVRLERALLVVQAGRPLVEVSAVQEAEQAALLLRRSIERLPDSYNSELAQDARLENIGADLERLVTLLQGAEAALTSADVPAYLALRPQISDLADQLRRQINDVAQDHTASLTAAAEQVRAEQQQQLTLALLFFLLWAVLALLALWLAGGALQAALKPLQIHLQNYQFGRPPPRLALSAGPFGAPAEAQDFAQALQTFTAGLHAEAEQVDTRIQQRTRLLEQRMLHLQVASEVARDAASVSELDTLLARAVHLVQVRFDFYFVAVFLLDEQRRFAILRSGTGEAGRALQERGFRLPLAETSLVGYACLNGLPRIVNDVENDFTHYKEPLLPFTRSEAVLPLKIGARVIGALDVQSTQLDAFPPEDLPVLQILADQLAVAMENARLLATLQTTLHESEQLYQRYAGQSWSAGSIQTPGYEFDLLEVRPIPPALAGAFVGGARAEALESLKAGRAVLADKIAYAPLRLYGRLVGLIGLEDNDPERVWSDDELSVLQALSAQISLALDNARLLEDSQRRSAQLRLLQQTAASAAGQTELNELLDQVCQALRSGLDLDASSAWLLAGEATNDSSAALSLQRVAWVERQLGLFKLPLPQITWPAGEAELAELRQGHSRAGRLSPAQADASGYWPGASEPVQVALLPVLSRSRLVALMLLQRITPFAGDELEVLNQVALQLGSAVEVALSFEQTARRAERERLIGEVTRRIRSTLDMDTILRSAAQEIRNIFALPGVAIRLFPAAAEVEPSADMAGEANQAGESHPPLRDTGPLGGRP